MSVRFLLPLSPPCFYLLYADFSTTAQSSHMLAVFFLIATCVFGYLLQRFILPSATTAAMHTNQMNSPPTGRTSLPGWMLTLPTAWILGGLIVTWVNFIICRITDSISGTLLTCVLLFTAIVYLFWLEHRRTGQDAVAGLFFRLRSDFRNTSFADCLFLTFAVGIACYIMWYTLHSKDGQLFIGPTVWSDFGPQLSLVRSFSVGENFPPQYPHYAAGNMPYHFMFQFYTGSIEYLGLPLHSAFNTLSAGSLICVFLLLYVLAFRITGSRLAAFLTGCFFIFRSSLAFFTYLSDFEYSEMWNAIINVDIFIGKTRHEDWGLWNQNVFANQRHLAFSISIMLMALIHMLPAAARDDSTADSRLHKKQYAWKVESWTRPLSVGIMLGAMAFWNGAVLITALLVLAGMALFSRNRLEYVTIAIIAVLLASIQSKWFTGSGMDAVTMKYHFGFLAEKSEVGSVAAYIIQLFGIFIPIFLIALLTLKRRNITFAFCLPFIFTFSVQATVDIAANHKFAALSVFLMGIPVAWLVATLWQYRRFFPRLLAIICTALLTVSGVVDIISLHNRNLNPGGFPQQHTMYEWIQKHTQPGDVFLTDRDVLSRVLFAGRPIYNGWSYFTWSAGYNTRIRDDAAREIYEAPTPQALRDSLRDRNIQYILVDWTARNSGFFKVNEEVIAQTFPLVYSDNENAKIYRITDRE